MNIDLLRLWYAAQIDFIDKTYESDHNQFLLKQDTRQR